jgi:hypothetical protein
MSSPQQQFNYDLIYLAVSAKQLDRPPSKDPRVTHLKDVMIENRMTLIDARNHGLFGGGIPIFESGASTAKHKYVLQSMMTISIMVICCHAE